MEHAVEVKPMLKYYENTVSPLYATYRRKCLIFKVMCTLRSFPIHPFIISNAKIIKIKLFKTTYT